MKKLITNQKKTITMKLQEELDKVDIPENFRTLDKLTQLALFWGVITVVLRFVKIFTGPKADEKIDMILEWGEQNLPKVR